MKFDLPHSFLLMLIVQTITVIVFFAELKASVENNIQDIAENNARIEAMNSIVQKQQISLARIDVNISHIRKTMDVLVGKTSEQ